MGRSFELGRPRRIRSLRMRSTAVLGRGADGDTEHIAGGCGKLSRFPARPIRFLRRFANASGRPSFGRRGSKVSPEEARPACREGRGAHWLEEGRLSISAPPADGLDGRRAPREGRRCALAAPARSIRGVRDRVPRNRCSRQRALLGPWKGPVGREVRARRPVPSVAVGRRLTQAAAPDGFTGRPSRGSPKSTPHHRLFSHRGRVVTWNVDIACRLSRL